MPRLMHDLFETQVEREPQAIAAVCCGVRYSYEELNARANQLAHHLKTLGVGPGALVAVSLERSLEMLSTVLGILKAGAAYVPMEVSFPRARVQWILSSLQIPVLVTHRAALFALPQAQQIPALRHVICLDSIDEPQQALAGHDWQVWTHADLERYPQSNLPAQASPTDLAYIIFTSGSTGTPKGVMVCHHPVLNLIDWVNTTFQIGPADRLLFITSLCFDLSIYDIFGMLAAGGSIHIATDQELRNPNRLLSLLLTEPITFWDSAPAALQQLAPLLPSRPGIVGGERLRLVFLSGDWIPVKLPDTIRRVFTQAQVISLGGATEATVWSNVYPIGYVDPAWSSIPYGKPIWHASYYILDANVQPCPANVAGDLYIAGLCLSLGYTNEPTLTAEKFLPNPFSDEAGARMYKTGDLARLWPDGNMEFLGRADSQVKVRGYRIELGEIETTLSKHAALQDAVVIAREYSEREKRLIAYLVPDQQRAYPVCRLLRFEQEGLLAHHQLHQLPNGMTVFHLNSGETAFMYQKFCEEQAVFSQRISLHEGDTVFDVGANIGIFSLLLAQMVPDLHFYAFEPLPPAAELLRLNASLYNLRLEAFDCGLSRASSNETFTYYPNVSILSSCYADPHEIRAAVQTFLLNTEAQPAAQALSQQQLDELLQERLFSQPMSIRLQTLSAVIHQQRIERIDLLKIDAEKSEQDVLAGIDEQDWPRIRQLVVEVADIDSRLQTIIALLTRHGFTVTSEQDTSLSYTSFYNVYAVRPDQEQARDDTRQPAYRWSSKKSLVNDVRSFLKEQLPEYMLPTAFVLLESLPVTANGKVDRKALHALPDPTRQEADQQFVAPRNEIEELLATVWATILGQQRIGINDDFFELGGHSLLATQIVTRVRDLYQVDLPLSSLFHASTVSAFAQAIAAHRQQAGDPAFFRIVPVARDTPYHPLSFPQEQVWFLLQLDPQNKAYQFQATLEMQGALNVAALQRSLNEIISRHEIFRTTFQAVDGQPVQLIQQPYAVNLPVIDLQAIPHQLRAEVAQRHIFQEFCRPFALNRLPLIRWTLLRLDKAAYMLTHVEHHLVHDGWSFNTFLHELLLLYRAFNSGQASPLPALPAQFVDFVYWQRRWAQSERAQEQLAYWKAQLADQPAPLALPTDRPRPPVQTFRGDALRIELPPRQCARLRSCCRREACTLYMVMLSLFLTLLYRYSGQEDISIGTGVANRRSREAEQLIGMIINTVVLRANLSGNPTFRELLYRVRGVTLGMYERQDLPFEKVVEALQPQRNLSYNPFFQVIFGFHDSPLDALELPDLELKLAEGLGNGSAKFDLNLIVIPRAEQAVGSKLSGQDAGITMVWEYNTDLFERSTVQRMMNAYQQLVDQLCADAAQPIASAPLLTDAELRQQLVEWNDTSVAFAADEPVTRLIERWAKQTPDATAVAYAEEWLTYGELNRRANQLAHSLQALKLGPENLVGICLERSLDLLVSLLGTLKAGCAYLPLDPAYPVERIEYMLEDVQVSALLTTSALRQQSVKWRSEHQYPLTTTSALIDLDDRHAQNALAYQHEENPPTTVKPENLAYVIYTSGSTGRPKGVQVTQRGLLNLVRWHQHTFAVTPRDRATQLASISFDAAGWEIWPYLASGATVCLVEDEARNAPRQLQDWLVTRQISISFLPTPLAESLLDADWPEYLALRILLTGGDVLHHAPAQDLPFAFVNNYGPTEHTVVTTSGNVARSLDKTAAPDIGRPIANTVVYVLDRFLQPVPLGVAGELYIGGEGLARGYLRHPDLTAERFLPHPFSARPGARLYKTGDIARYRDDGALAFLRRNDGQVKIRGFRIEPGEIEATLRRYPTVRDAVVMAREDKPGLSGGAAEKRLVAYVVPVDASVLAPSQAELHAFLQGKLPAYMLPTAIVILDRLPLTANGKVDHQALPAPTATRAELAEFVPPRTAVEAQIAQLWTEVLGVERIGIYDNFFELGGHSLLATQVIARTLSVFQVDLPVRALFEQPRVVDLARLVERMQDGGAAHAIAQPFKRASSEQDAARLLANLEQLSAEEVDALLSVALAEYEGKS